MEREQYEDLVNKWSRIYKSKIGELFTLEELVQESWVALLTAEERDTFDNTQGVPKEVYLSSCIRNHLIDLIADELEHKHARMEYDDGIISEVSTNSAISKIISKDLEEKLKQRIKKYKNATVVYDIMTGRSLEEIRAILEYQHNIKLTRAAIHLIIKKIRKEFRKLLED